MLHELLSSLVFTQPEPESHESSVHSLPSSQSGGDPPTQPPPLQVSFCVHASPSLHAALLFVKTQPDPELHESFVHRLPSLQLGAVPV